MTKLQIRPMVVIIRDGWGYNPYPKWNSVNAVHLAKTPVDDWLMREYPHIRIHTSGEDVGLPPDTMGNSEVGHQNIGAGRVVDQELLRISKMVRSGEFSRNRSLVAAMEHAKARRSNLHLIGLASDAGVHSALNHLYTLLALAKEIGVSTDRVLVHNFSDGRDCPPMSGINFCRQIEAQNEKRLVFGRIASVVGRYYAMDRDDRWDRVEKAYQLLTGGEGDQVRAAVEGYQRYYDNPTTTDNQGGDEFIEPTVVIDNKGNPLPRISDGDAVIFYNFRGDRPRQLCKAFCRTWSFHLRQPAKTVSIQRMGFERGQKLEIQFVTMTEYERGLPVEVAISKPPKMYNILGCLCKRGRIDAISLC